MIERDDILFSGLLLALLAFALVVRLQYGLDYPIESVHAHRQAHVASNIEYYIRDGLAIPGDLYTKNYGTTVFDFPLYQYITAILAKGL